MRELTPTHAACPFKKIHPKLQQIFFYYPIIHPNSYCSINDVKVFFSPVFFSGGFARNLVKSVTGV